MTLPSETFTIGFVTKLHEEQTDKAGRPYIEHLRAVANKAREYGASDFGVHAAWLHDSVEDTDLTLDSLRSVGYPEEVVEIVSLVTRTPEKGTYMDFIRSIADSGNRDAILVKLADNWHNNLPKRIAALPPELQSLSKRYDRAREILLRARDGL